MTWRFETHLWSVIIRETELLGVYSEYECGEFESIVDAPASAIPDRPPLIF